jgi:hypothetical protein
MLLNQHQIRADIATLSRRLEHSQQELADQRLELSAALRRNATSPRTLGIIFGVGLAYGLLNKRNLLPPGVGWLLTRGGSSLLLSMLARFTEGGEPPATE